MQDNDQIIDEVTSSDYKYGFTTDIDTETIGKGLTEDTVRLISEKKGEPEWLLEFRLEAFPPLADPRAARLGAPEDPPDRLSGHHLLRCTQEEGRAEEPR